MTSSLSIIGAGIAGLSTGIYARLNGYQARIFEKHSLPGGLCTAWKRQDYLVDGCIHWLCGSGPGMAGLYSIWQELGATQTLNYINHQAFIILDLPDLKFTLYNDADELETYLLRLALEDASVIKELCQAVRDFGLYDGQDTPEAGAYLAKWSSLTGADYVGRFENPTVRRALSMLMGNQMPAYFALLPLGYGHRKSAGYPIGGSLEFARALEKRFLDLGGEIIYRAGVKKILVEQNRAVGLEFEDGQTIYEREGDIISAADGHATIFDMLGGRYLDDRIRAWFDQVPVIPSPVQVTLGVAMDLKDAPASTSGFLMVPATPVTLYGQPQGMLNVEPVTYEPHAAPQGKSTLRVNFWGNYAFWKELRQDPAAYAAEKDRIVQEVITALDIRFPGLAQKVEMVDVATPVTFERYTSNWQGSSQGWVPTPQAVAWQQESAQNDTWPAGQALPGLTHFHMAGQWVETFGGLPGAALSARRLVTRLCERDGREFTTG
jgi:phytoene dehydrogenase-like protein